VAKAEDSLWLNTALHYQAFMVGRKKQRGQIQSLTTSECEGHFKVTDIARA